MTLPAIGYIWWSGDYGTVAAVSYTVLLFAAGMTDNVLKPLMLGRGVDAPMPVILLGALGGMATAGILGMFVGATLLALGYQIFTGWVAATKVAAGRSPEDRCRCERLSVSSFLLAQKERRVVDGDGAAARTLWPRNVVRGLSPPPDARAIVATVDPVGVPSS